MHLPGGDRRPAAGWPGCVRHRRERCHAGDQWDHSRVPRGTGGRRRDRGSARRRARTTSQDPSYRITSQWTGINAAPIRVARGERFRRRSTRVRSVSMTEVPTVRLNNDTRMPQLGFGVFQVPPEETAQAVQSALQAGYRSLDTAAAYGNEAGVAEGIRAAGVAREELFITTKLWNSDHGHDAAQRGLDTSLEKLGTGRDALNLIPWPVPEQDRYVESWKALEKLHSDGRSRAIGVSNFHPKHLRRLLDESDTVPAVNQVELHPRLSQAELRSFHAEHNIATEAW